MPSLKRPLPNCRIFSQSISIPSVLLTKKNVGISSELSSKLRGARASQIKGGCVSLSKVTVTFLFYFSIFWFLRLPVSNRRAIRRPGFQKAGCHSLEPGALIRKAQLGLGRCTSPDALKPPRCHFAETLEGDF